MRTTTSLSEGRAYLFLSLFGERRVRDSPISLSVVFCFAVPAIHSDLPELRCHSSARWGRPDRMGLTSPLVQST